MKTIDIHHHMIPPNYIKAWQKASTMPKGLVLPSWSPELSLDFMNRNDINVAILSLSAPALSFAEGEEAHALCREVNHYAAAVRDQYPHRFGFFATLPTLLDTEVCLKEIAYAMDELGADGVTLFTSYNQLYLGHQAFQPIWKELNRRNAVVFIHPGFPVSSTTPAAVDPALPTPVIDFPHETTRAAVHLIVSNTIQSYPNCKIILSHGGGTLPYVATRYANQLCGLGLCKKTIEEFLKEAKSFYFDLALAAYDNPVELLVQYATADHILYGSDYPFAREKTITPQLAYLNERFPKTESSGIMQGCATKLFPRFFRVGQNSGPAN